MTSDEEAAAREESEAKEFIEMVAPEYVKYVGVTLGSYSEAQAIWRILWICRAPAWNSN